MSLIASIFTWAVVREHAPCGAWGRVWVGSHGASRACEQKMRCAGLGGGFVSVSSGWLVVVDLAFSVTQLLAVEVTSVTVTVLSFACVLCQCLLYLFQSVITFTHFEDIYILMN